MHDQESKRHAHTRIIILVITILMVLVFPEAATILGALVILATLVA